MENVFLIFHVLQTVTIVLQEVMVRMELVLDVQMIVQIVMMWIVIHVLKDFT